MDYNVRSNCAYSFGDELYRGCTDGYLNLAIFQRSGAKRFFSIPISEAKASSLNAAVEPWLNANVFFQVNPISSKIGGHARGSLKDVASVPAFFADIDFKNPGKKQDQLPQNGADALRMFGLDGFLAPTMIVETGRGLHAYWVFDEPVVIDSEQARDVMVEAAGAFGSAFRSFAFRKFGWKFDSTSDLPRLGRLPGTFNLKGEAPLPVVWRTDPSSCRYTLDDVVSEMECHRPPSGSKAKAVSLGASKPAPTSVSLDQALRRSEARWRISRLSEDGKANGASMMEGCAFLRHAAEMATSIAEPEWFDALRLISRAENDEEIAHAISAPNAGYSQAETAAKLEHASAYDSDLTCDHLSRTHVSSGCATCPFRGKLHSPTGLGQRSRSHIELLANTAYVQRTDEFFDLRRMSNSGSKADAFSRMNADKGLPGKPAVVLTKDVLAIKAHQRAYRPDKPRGTFEERGGIYLNFYMAPKHDQATRLPRRFYQHLRYLVPDRQERKVVIRWLAHLVQKPWEKLGYAVALIGGQGTGKSWVLNLMTEVLGAGNVTISGGRSVMSNFNGHLAGRVLLGLEEVTITGRAEAYEGLKALITNDVAEFERKHVQPEELQTPRGVLVLSNDAYALHLPPDDRRFFVAQTPAQKHSGGSAYYEKLFALTDDFVASVYWSLMAVNLEGFKAKTPPFMTAAKARMADYSRADIDVLVEELVNEQRGPFAEALIRWDDLRSFVREQSPDRDLSDKRIKRALEVAGVVIDPQKRQCRLSDKVRSILYFVRCVDEMSDLTAVELAVIFKGNNKRFDVMPEIEPPVPDMFEATARGRTR